MKFRKSESQLYIVSVGLIVLSIVVYGLAAYHALTYIKYMRGERVTVDVIGTSEEYKKKYTSTGGRRSTTTYKALVKYNSDVFEISITQDEYDELSPLHKLEIHYSEKYPEESVSKGSFSQKPATVLWGSVVGGSMLLGGVAIYIYDHYRQKREFEKLKHAQVVKEKSDNIEGTSDAAAISNFTLPIVAGADQKPANWGNGMMAQLAGHQAQLNENDETKMVYRWIINGRVEFDGSEKCAALVRNHLCTPMATSNAVAPAMLEFTDGALSKVFKLDESESHWVVVPKNPSNLRLAQLNGIKAHAVFALTKSSNGDNQLGGNPPSDFLMPTVLESLPVQYLGCLSKSENPFNFLPFDLHLIYPTYLNLYEMYVDYTNPMSPKIIYVEESVKGVSQYTDEEIKKLAPEFKEVKFKTVRKDSHTFNSERTHLGWSGLPEWVQAPRAPKSPVNDEYMEFVCEITGGLQILPSRDKLENNIFVFFEPKSKVACYFTQNT